MKNESEDTAVPVPHVPKVFIMFAMHRRMIMLPFASLQYKKNKKQIRQNVIADLIAYLKIRGKK